MKKIVLLTLSLTLLLSSCVSKKKYNQLKEGKAEVEQYLREYKDKLYQCENDKDKFKTRLEALQQNNKTLQDALDKCVNLNQQGNINISKLLDEINTSNKYIRMLIVENKKKDSLNKVLTSRITRSLKDVDTKDLDVKVKKGVVFISLSDKMMFKSGKTQISKQADSVLFKLAKIINDYKDYEVLIEGHTDNVPIHTKCIKDNWDLSALRATAIARKLQKDFGVDPARLTAGGRGEWVPKVPNDSPQNRELNRRTEIILLPKLDQFNKLMKEGENQN
jgi:chemotaxis protein MotB